MGVFPFPKFEGSEGELKELAVDAPIDGFVLTDKRQNPRSPEREKKALELIRYIGSKGAFFTYDERNRGAISVNKNVSPSDYKTELQKMTAEMLSHPRTKIGIFLSRQVDTEFVDNIVVPQINRFLGDPSTSNIDSVLTSIKKGRRR